MSMAANIEIQLGKLRRLMQRADKWEMEREAPAIFDSLYLELDRVRGLETVAIIPAPAAPQEELKNAC